LGLPVHIRCLVYWISDLVLLRGEILILPVAYNEEWAAGVDGEATLKIE
jgi:hypothetical protein